jgi:hypothetical protein
MRLAEVAAVDGVAGVAFVVDLLRLDQAVAQAEGASWVASSSSLGARLAETAVAARAAPPSSCCATTATSVESTPAEKAVMADP